MTETNRILILSWPFPRPPKRQAIPQMHLHRFREAGPFTVVLQIQKSGLGFGNRHSPGDRAGKSPVRNMRLVAESSRFSRASPAWCRHRSCLHLSWWSERVWSHVRHGDSSYLKLFYPAPFSCLRFQGGELDSTFNVVPYSSYPLFWAQDPVPLSRPRLLIGPMTQCA